MSSPESITRECVARLQEALAAPDSGQFATSRVNDYDVRVLFETIKRYGGRKDWAPSEENISKLPSPVRRYIYELRTEIQRLEREVVRKGRL